LPLGGHLGYGLAVMWQVLTGVLSGADRFGQDVGGPNDPHDVGMGISVFTLAIDPAAVMPIEDFKRRVDRLVEELHTSEPATGVERVRLPGERGFNQAAHNEAHGVDISDAVLDTLGRLGDRFGVQLAAS
jgi:LDH2 family malate/lactate/ureidoglycolate dehydrogenase